MQRLSDGNLWEFRRQRAMNTFEIKGRAMSYEVRMWGRGWYRIPLVLVGSLLFLLPACNLVGGKTTVLSLDTAPPSIAAGSQTVFTATISHNNGQFLGANWTLAINGVACQAACGT